MTHERPPAAALTDRSPVIPLLLALAAPLAVIVSIGILHNVWWTFATYQVGICLVAPALESRLAGRSRRDHAALLGLLDPPGAGGPPSWRTTAIVLGLATALVTGGFLVLTREHFLDAERLEATVADWGVSPERMVIMIAVVAVLNAAAEELFWRGYLPGRVAVARPDSPAPVVLTVVLPAVLYASYHALTIGRLVGDAGGVLVMTGGVLGAGLFWGWLRRRTRSVWPPLLSHAGAVVAYLAVHFWLTATGGG
jgi:membrane protease YdiL (CAAX protease family)